MNARQPVVLELTRSGLRRDPERALDEEGPQEKRNCCDLHSWQISGEVVASGDE